MQTDGPEHARSAESGAEIVVSYCLMKLELNRGAGAGALAALLLT